MEQINIDIDSIILKLGISMPSQRAEGIAGDAVGILEELIRNHSFDISSSSAKYNTDTIKIPSITVSDGFSDDEISRAIAREIFYALIQDVSM